MENNISKEDYTNRKIDGIPKKSVIMELVISGTFGDEIYKCNWKPYNENNYTKHNQPAKGYLGTATVISGRYKGIGFHAWDQNDAEFIYYKILEK